MVLRGAWLLHEARVSEAFGFQYQNLLQTVIKVKMLKKLNQTVFFICLVVEWVFNW